MTRIRITIGIMTRLATDCSLTRSHCRQLHSSSSSCPSPHTRRRKVKRKMMILYEDDDHDYPPHTKRRKRRRKMMTRIRMTIRMRTKITSDFISTQLSTPHLLLLLDACSRVIWWSSGSESEEFDDHDCISSPLLLLQSSHTNVGDHASSAKVYLCHPRLLILILSLILIKLWLLIVDSW